MLQASGPAPCLPRAEAVTQLHASKETHLKAESADWPHLGHLPTGCPLESWQRPTWLGRADLPAPIGLAQLQCYVCSPPKWCRHRRCGTPYARAAGNFLFPHLHPRAFWLGQEAHLFGPALARCWQGCPCPACDTPQRPSLLEKRVQEVCLLAWHHQGCSSDSSCKPRSSSKLGVKEHFGPPR